MRTIKNSIGATYPIALTLGDVRRLQAGVEIETGRTLVEDFGHSDKDKLQDQIDRIMSLPLFAVELIYALLPSSVRSQVSFAVFLGDDAAAEPWKPEELLLATQALVEEVLLFFQSRIPLAALAKRTMQVIQKDTAKAVSEIEALPEEKVRSMMEAIYNDETNGGPASTDSPESPGSETSTDSPGESSTTEPPEPSSDPPSAPPPSAPLPDSSSSLSIGS